jgi:hypothetical protein
MRATQHFLWNESGGDCSSPSSFLTKKRVSFLLRCMAGWPAARLPAALQFLLHGQAYGSAPSSVLRLLVLPTRVCGCRLPFSGEPGDGRPARRSIARNGVVTGGWCAWRPATGDALKTLSARADHLLDRLPHWPIPFVRPAHSENRPHDKSL